MTKIMLKQIESIIHKQLEGTKESCEFKFPSGWACVNIEIFVKEIMVKLSELNKYD